MVTFLDKVAARKHVMMFLSKAMFLGSKGDSIHVKIAHWRRENDKVLGWVLSRPRKQGTCRKERPMLCLNRGNAMEQRPV